uniref:response regulator transcription factor n=1 Tax=Lachnospira sp. TaxID=2049031 RepID=UPI003FEEAB9D
MATVLIVDDEEDIRELVGIYLKNEGYNICKAVNGQEALQCLSDMQIDLAVLDVMMADMDGIALCMEIRKKSNIPIIMLSAKDQDMDKVIGLSAGADDYLAKPFNPVELVARVKAQLRRFNDFNERKPSSILEYMELSMNLETHRVFLNLKEVQLTPKEFAILELLWKNKGNVFSTEHIYDSLWSEEEAYDINNVVMVHIRNLRSKIEPDIKNPQYIKTVWGVGYKFS